MADWMETAGVNQNQQSMVLISAFLQRVLLLLVFYLDATLDNTVFDRGIQ